MALEDSVEELEPLSFILGRLLDQLCARLNARSLAAIPFACVSSSSPLSKMAFSALKEDSRRSRNNKKPRRKNLRKIDDCPFPCAIPKCF